MASQAAGPSWRLLPFFTQTPVGDVDDASSTPEAFRSPAEISATARTSQGVAIADIHGGVRIMGPKFESSTSWKAHTDGRVTHLVERKGILVTLGEERSSRPPLLRIWDLEHRDNSTNTPALLRSVKVQHGPRPDPATTIALSSSLSHLAIGFGDGTVLMYRHLDQSLFSGSNSLTALPKPKTIHESPTEPITGLGFREPQLSALASHDKEKEREKESLFLFIVTTNRVLSYIAAGKSSGSTPTTVDEVGCGLGCATMHERTQEMVLARDDAIYMCSSEGRGACYVTEWPKISATSFKNYLIVVSPPFFPTGSSASATVRNYVARTPNASAVDVSKLTILDMENHLTAYSGATFVEGVRDVFVHDGTVYVLGNDTKLFRMEEKSTPQKLDLLFGKSLFPVAIGLAKSEGLDEAGIAAIHKQYADHLYAKGEFEPATVNYVKTLGFLQPSYVIRKFLDAQQIHNLTTYLQELHTRGLANSDHTTLLLNTYTKLRDVTRLDNFIKSTDSTKSRKNRENADRLPFDLETAIRVCRQASYFEHAVYLAKKYKRHDDYLRIQIEDIGNVKDALVYIRSLGLETAPLNLLKYGRTLLSKLPDDTTQLLIDVCSGVGDLSSALPRAPTAETAVAADGNSSHSRSPTSGSGIPYLSLLNYNRVSAVYSGTTEQVPPTAQDEPTVTVGPSNGAFKGLGTSEGAAELTDDFVRPSRKPVPRPSQYFAHFVDHRTHFIRFLEAVANNRWGQRVEIDHNKHSLGSSTKPEQYDSEEQDDQIAIWNTLLELYLSAALDLSTTAVGTGTADSDEVRRLKAQTMHVLQNEAILPYEPVHALIVCSTHSFTDGLVLLWEKLGMYEEILRFWMDVELHPETFVTTSSSSAASKSASARVVDCLDLYGPQHPHLYPLVLRFLTSSPALLSRHATDLKRLLEVVDKEGYMVPLGVVQILSRNDVASVGLVKEWLLARIAESREGIEADRELILSYRAETRTKIKEIGELSDPDKPRVFHATRCSVCGSPLDLPAVHFMCNHSYHSRCLNEHETECPNCARDHGLVREIRRDNKQFATQHDLFLYNIENEGFSAIASAFSRGILGRGFDSNA